MKMKKLIAQAKVKKVQLNDNLEDNYYWKIVSA